MNEIQRRRFGVRFIAVWGWVVMTLAVAGFAVLKPTTTSADLLVLPQGWIAWLDANYNVRTLIMTTMIAVPPSLLLIRSEHNSWRRRLLVLITGVLVLFEFLQIWLPHRVFGLPDVGYTLAGGLLTEVLILCARGIFPHKPRV